MRSALADLKLQSLDVIHAGEHSYPIGEKVRAVALSRLLIDLKPQEVLQYTPGFLSPHSGSEFRSCLASLAIKLQSIMAPRLQLDVEAQLAFQKGDLPGTDIAGDIK